MALVAVMTGCIPTARVGEMQTESRSIDLDDAELVRAEIRMTAGQLDLRGGALKLLEAEFHYNVPSWRPEIRYERTGFRGQLSVTQPSSAPVAGSAENRWVLLLNPEVPLDLTVVLGAGEAELDLGRLSLRSANVKVGAGKVKVEFSETPKKSFDLNIKGGVGEAIVYLPSEIGVIARASGGIGGIEVSNLRKEGGAWVNEAYGKSKVTLRLNVTGGVGSITLVG